MMLANLQGGGSGGVLAPGAVVARVRRSEFGTFLDFGARRTSSRCKKIRKKNL